ncbi:MAG: DNA helicase UvrD [Bacteroidetes bacterium]|nr:MAG: DNA helicase UvrD [Bacteroidota bacterium]
MSLAREKLQQNFQKEYDRLNERQKKAVDKIEGPVMVIAGPGTGKTQILAARIGKILLETDARPDNILCLTYTDAGKLAMRKRLLQFIGADAYKININTFHGFCNEVIQDNLTLFEKNELDPISDLERVELIKELIDAFPKNHPLKKYRGDVYSETKNLQGLFSSMKREGWTEEFLMQKIEEYLNDLPTRDDYIYKKAGVNNKKGDLKLHKIEEQTKKMEKLRAAVGEFSRFQELMRRRNRYDFDDMINWVVKAFEENKNLIASYQEQYQYILVDEYQDTSGSQNRIVELLISYWDKPNVFVVGDDDQSIFRFQGANLHNMLDFAEKYEKDLLKLVLVNNYRSSQPILDISKTLIEKNIERLVSRIEGLSKDLKSSHPEKIHLSEPPVINEYESQKQEMAFLCLQVEELIRQNVEPWKIGIIYKENKYGEELISYFRQRKIPFYSKRAQDVFDVPIARKMILLMRFLVAELDVPSGGDEMLFEILHFDWFRVPPIEIAKLSIEVADRPKDQKTSLRQLLAEKASSPPRDLFSKGINEGLIKANKVIEELIGDVYNITLQQLVEKIIRQTGLLSVVMKSPEKIWLIQVITAFFDFIKEETRRNPSLQLKELINIFDLMEKEGLSLPIVQITGSDVGVNLLTAHGSKGLEFEYVFFVGCSANYWEAKRAPNRGYALPDTIYEYVGGEQTRERIKEELRRLFYVAITRAERHLQISYSRFTNDGKQQEPSVFIAEILDEHDLKTNRIPNDENILTEFNLSILTESGSPEIEKMEAEFVTRLLSNFAMNVTALNNYLRCPLEFYFKNLVRIPSPKNEATEFGSSVHYALEMLFKKMKSSNETFPSKEEFVDYFEWYMTHHRESFTREQFERRMEYGRDILANYYDNYLQSWNKIVSIELNIRAALVSGIPIRGKLDKIEFDGNFCNVVDYKTGDPDKAQNKLKPPHEKDPNGGDYWRQAVFYKILVDNYKSRSYTVMSSEFDFIEPDKNKKYRKSKIVISPSDEETVKQQIISVWEKIQNREFYTGCGKSDCHWCNFVKTNDLAIAMHEVYEEEETDLSDY